MDAKTWKALTKQMPRLKKSTAGNAAAPNSVDPVDPKPAGACDALAPLVEDGDAAMLAEDTKAARRMQKSISKWWNATATNNWPVPQHLVLAHHRQHEAMVAVQMGEMNGNESSEPTEHDVRQLIPTVLPWLDLRRKATAVPSGHKRGLIKEMATKAMKMLELTSFIRLRLSGTRATLIPSGTLHTR